MGRRYCYSLYGCMVCLTILLVGSQLMVALYRPNAPPWTLPDDEGQVGHQQDGHFNNDRLHPMSVKEDRGDAIALARNQQKIHNTFQSDTRQEQMPTSSSRTDIDRHHHHLSKTSSDRNVKYMLPVLLGNQGPNNQLQSLKLISILAKKRNLTLVAAPFFDHHAYNMELQGLRPFSETLDPEALAKFVPVVSLEEFKTKCNSSVEAVFVGSNMKAGQSAEETKGLNHFIDVCSSMYFKSTGIRIPSVLANENRSDTVIRIADNLPYLVPEDDFLDAYPEALTTTSRCNAFLYPYGYLGRLLYHKHIHRYADFFVRSKRVISIARRFLSEVMGNKPYLCIHWRFNAEWVEAWCKKGFALDLCHNVRTMSAQHLAKKIFNILVTRNLSATYFAAKLDKNDTILRHLRNILPAGAVFSADDLFRFEPTLEGDNYITSLVEQELCKESSFFLASAYSSWSDMVKEDRLDQGFKEVTDLLTENDT